MTGRMHLARRLATSLTARQPRKDEIVRVAAILSPGEMRLWSAMQSADRRHSLTVLDRRESMRPIPDRDERAAALLHDVGKSASRLGTMGRVLATVVGPRSWRFRLYREHESIGVRMLEGASTSRTIGVLDGSLAVEAELLRAADDL